MINSSATICIDASIIIRLILGGPGVEAVREQWTRWIGEDVDLIAPPLLAFEVTSVIWRQVHQKILTPKQGSKALQTALGQGVRLEYPKGLHDRAWKIAHRFNQPQAYDAHYLALAEYFGCQFWTLDQGLYQTVGSKLRWVHLM